MVAQNSSSTFGRLNWDSSDGICHECWVSDARVNAKVDFRKRKDFGWKRAVTNSNRSICVVYEAAERIASKITFFSNKNEWAIQLEYVGQIYFLQKDFYEAQKNVCIIFVLPCSYRPFYCSSWRPRFIHSWKDIPCNLFSVRPSPF